MISHRIINLARLALPLGFGFLPFVAQATVAGEEESAIPFYNWLVSMGGQHMIAFLLGIVAIAIGIKAKRAVGGKVGEAATYFFWGIFAFELIHLTELLNETWGLYSLPGDGQEITEFVLQYVGLGLVAYGFYRIITILRVITRA